MPGRDLVFFSYNRRDGRWLDPVRGALEPYVLDEKLSTWSDQDIETGRRWESEIQGCSHRPSATTRRSGRRSLTGSTG